MSVRPGQSDAPRGRLAPWTRTPRVIAPARRRGEDIGRASLPVAVSPVSSTRSSSARGAPRSGRSPARPGTEDGANGDGYQRAAVGGRHVVGVRQLRDPRPASGRKSAARRMRPGRHRHRAVVVDRSPRAAIFAAEPRGSAADQPRRSTCAMRGMPATSSAARRRDVYAQVGTTTRRSLASRPRHECRAEHEREPVERADDQAVRVAHVEASRAARAVVADSAATRVDCRPLDQLPSPPTARCLEHPRRALIGRATRRGSGCAFGRFEDGQAVRRSPPTSRPVVARPTAARGLLADADQHARRARGEMPSPHTPCRYGRACGDVQGGRAHLTVERRAVAARPSTESGSARCEPARRRRSGSLSARATDHASAALRLGTGLGTSAAVASSPGSASRISADVEARFVRLLVRPANAPAARLGLAVAVADVQLDANVHPRSTRAERGKRA